MREIGGMSEKEPPQAPVGRVQPPISRLFKPPPPLSEARQQQQQKLMPVCPCGLVRVRH